VHSMHAQAVMLGLSMHRLQLNCSCSCPVMLLGQPPVHHLVRQRSLAACTVALYLATDTLAVMRLQLIKLGIKHLQKEC
jgi:hypothetical protein